MTASFRATADASHIYRERTAAITAAMSTASVSDSFAEAMKNAIVLQPRAVATKQDVENPQSINQVTD